MAKSCVLNEEYPVQLITANPNLAQWRARFSHSEQTIATLDPLQVIGCQVIPFIDNHPNHQNVLE